MGRKCSRYCYDPTSNKTSGGCPSYYFAILTPANLSKQENSPCHPHVKFLDSLSNQNWPLKLLLSSIYHASISIRKFLKKSTSSHLYPKGSPPTSVMMDSAWDSKDWSLGQKFERIVITKNQADFKLLNMSMNHNANQFSNATKICFDQIACCFFGKHLKF